MILGVDAGTSAVKLAVLDGDNVILTHYERNFGGSKETLYRAMWNSGARDLPLDTAAITGLNRENCGMDMLGMELFAVPEVEAIGRGGCFLSGRDNALMVNLGTGSTFVHAKEGEFTHLGGSGVGGGTLLGLSRKLFGFADGEKLAQLAEQGDLSMVDLRIGDLFSGSETLRPELTASNLAKYEPDATDADWAAGILNLVLESVGTMAMLACQSCGAEHVVLLGALADTEAARFSFGRFDANYAPSFVTAPKAACATAIGAALAAKVVLDAEAAAQAEAWQ